MPDRTQAQFTPPSSSSRLSGRGPFVRRLESAANPEWKLLRKAFSQGLCMDGGYWIAETPRLLAEAVRSGLRVQRVYASARRLAALLPEYGGSLETEWVEVSARAMQVCGATETSQEVLALVQRKEVDRHTFFASQQLMVVLDRVQDPGNAGAIIRSAEAFGATGLVFLRGSASPDAPKVLRASAGSLFRLPFLQHMEVRELLKLWQPRSIYAASPEASDPIGSVPLRFPAALVIGNEGAGISPALEQHSLGFRIPTRGVESLNAAVSAGIALYEFAKGLDARPAIEQGGDGGIE